MSEKSESESRRNFLKLGVAAAPAAVIATASGANAEPADPDLSSDKMQDTAHTRAYLDSARF